MVWERVKKKKGNEIKKRKRQRKENKAKRKGQKGTKWNEIECWQFTFWVELSSFNTLLTLCFHISPSKAATLEKQKQGQRQHTLNLFEAATHCSRGDLSSLLVSLINKRKHEETRKELVTHLLATNKISPIVLQIKQSHDSAKTEHWKTKVAQTHVNRVVMQTIGGIAQLEGWGYSLAKLTKAATNPKKTTKLQTSQTNNTSSRSINFYTNNTNPAGNTTRYDEGTQVHVPVRSRSLTKKQLHTQYSEEHSKGTEHHVSYSTFCWSEPNFVTKSKAETRHVRALCERRGGWERELAKRRRVGSSCEGLSTDEADSAAKNLTLVQDTQICCVFTAPKLQSTTERTCKPGEVLVVLDFKENLTGWIWSNRSWKRVLQQDASFLLGICCLQWWKHNHPLFWLHFLLSLSYDGLFVWERVWAKSFLKFKKMSPVKVKQWVFVNLFLLFSIFDIWLVFLLINFWLSGFLWSNLTLFFPIVDCFFFLQTFLLAGLWFSLSLLQSDERYSLWTEHRSTKIETIGVNFFAEHHGKSAVDSHFSHVSRAVGQRNVIWAPYKHWWPQKGDYFVLWAVQNFSDSQNNSTPTTHSNQKKILLFQSKKKLNINRKLCWRKLSK